MTSVKTPNLMDVCKNGLSLKSGDVDKYLAKHSSNPMSRGTCSAGLDKSLGLGILLGASWMNWRCF
jgi:hypothetical protein